MIWSFSRIHSFFTCPYSFEQYYIFGEEQVDGFFGQFGSFCHLVLEKYFKEELEIWDLIDFYESHYYEEVTVLPPLYPKNMADTYFQRGYDFFSNFEFDKSEWEILAIEESYFTEIDKYKIVVKPDLVLRNKETGKLVIFDYKTSDVSKKDEFNKAQLQINFYALGLLYCKGWNIDEGTVLAVRTGEKMRFDITSESRQYAHDWFLNRVEKIEEEENFAKGKVSEWFCDYLCGSREKCKYRNETQI